jgi:hypothetical protein
MSISRDGFLRGAAAAFGAAGVPVLAVGTAVGATPSAEAQSDYLEYFFLRSKGAGGPVMTFRQLGRPPEALAMTAHSRGPQLWKFSSWNNKNARYINIVTHEVSGDSGALTLDGSRLSIERPAATQTQQWSITSTNQIVCAANAELALSVKGAVYEMARSNPDDPNQQFETLFPSDFVYVRHCWTGRFLTGDLKGGVTWNLLQPAQDDYQQWGVTSDGFLVNRATAQVVQVSSISSSGGTCTLGSQTALGPNALNQRFDFNRLDGSVHLRLTRNGTEYALANGGTDTVAQVVPAVAGDQKQLIELISPFQFFGLLNGASLNNHDQWLSRQGNSVSFAPALTASTYQLFTVSRYGEIISLVDGYVLQSLGNGKTPAFVDPAPDPIGWESTTFRYDPAAGLEPRGGGAGIIALRGEPSLGLIEAGPPVMYSPLVSPAGGNQVWKLVGPADSIFGEHTDLARQFFANPAPLPGHAAAGAAPDAATTALTAQLDKTTKVILTLVTGILDIVAGISVGSISSGAVTRLSVILLGEANLANKIAVIMGGTCSVASIIGVADAITKAHLWYKLFDLLLPSSFWGWTLTILKLGVTIASYVIGVGVAITGAKIALVVAQILYIIKSDAAESMREARLIAAHARRLQSAPH